MLTFEEMSTLLCWIEACLNSYPIAPVSNNLDDYHPLILGHFLESLLSLPPNQVLDLNEQTFALANGSTNNQRFLVVIR